MNSLTSQTVSAWTEAITADVAPKEVIGYLRAQYRSRIQQAILAQFIKMQKEGLTRAAMARKIRKRPEIITRLLNGAGNLTLDTVSDLMFALGGRPATVFESLLETPAMVTTELPDAQLENKPSTPPSDESTPSRLPQQPASQENAQLVQDREREQQSATVFAFSSYKSEKNEQERLKRTLQAANAQPPVKPSDNARAFG